MTNPILVKPHFFIQFGFGGDKRVDGIKWTLFDSLNPNVNRSVVEWIERQPQIKPISGRVDKASATEAVDTGSIPGRVKPKTIKIGIYSFPA